MGLVYILKSKNLYKIGYTTKPLSSRLSDLAVGNPFGISVWTTYPHHIPARLESFLQGKFQHRHVIGEWYKLSFVDRHIRLPRYVSDFELSDQCYDPVSH